MMILRSLMREPMHGYALVQHIKQRSNDLLQVEEGSLYPALQRLLKEGLLKAEWEISASNRRVRTYRITAAGRKHLDAEISSFERMLAKYREAQRVLPKLAPKPKPKRDYRRRKRA